MLVNLENPLESNKISIILENSRLFQISINTQLHREKFSCCNCVLLMFFFVEFVVLLAWTCAHCSGYSKSKYIKNCIAKNEKEKMDEINLKMGVVMLTWGNCRFGLLWKRIVACGKLPVHAFHENPTTEEPSLSKFLDGFSGGWSQLTLLSLFYYILNLLEQQEEDGWHRSQK